MEKEIVLQMKGISKSFGTNKVLSDVQFELRKGEIHALLGENGAGKSTLLNIMTGTFRADSGEIMIEDRPTEIKNLTMARDLGIVRVHQELQLVQEMTVGQNIFLGREPKTGAGLIDYEEIFKRADEILKKLDADFSSKAIVSSLSTAQQQMIEISKALLQDFIVLALDEPTSSLTSNEIEKLMQTMDNLRKEGKSIIYISHRMEEIFRITDRATIFRDGRYIGTVETAKTDKAELIKMMVGRNIADQRFNEVSNIQEEVALEVKNLSGKGFQDISFQLHKGEVLGFAGLVGAGRTEVMRAVFGIDRHSGGQIFVNGREVSVKKPLDAQKEGIMLIPEDRKYQGMVGILSNRANIVLSNLKKYVKHGILDHAYIKKDAREYMDRLQVVPRDDEYETGRLSGGNQQKVVIARTMNVDPDILILDEPTRGIDINVKFEIYKLIRQFADEGKAVIMISSELPEVISLSDRVIVMYEGKITGELESGELTEERIMMYAMGGENNGKNENNI